MNDENTDLYDDGSNTDNPPADAADQKPSYDGGDDPVSSDPYSGNTDQTVADGASGSDGTDGENTETDGDIPAETENGEIPGTEETQTPEDGFEDAESEEGEEAAEGGETEQIPTVDPEILLDIRDTLHNHTDSVNDFTSGLTVSGNVIQVSLDSGSTALLTESVDQQNKILDGLDSMIGLILLVFFVLVFDLLHRFAKRIIKNFMGGDKNGTNS